MPSAGMSNTRPWNSQEIPTIRVEAMVQHDHDHPRENGLTPVLEEPETTRGGRLRRMNIGFGRRRDIQIPTSESRILIKPSDCGDRLGYKWSERLKWARLWIIFLTQVSMNLNTTLYSNAISGISEHYGVTPFDVRWGGAASFLIAYAFGCELWAPWSEEFGRKPVLQISLGLVNIWGILVWFAPNWPAHVVGRTLGGLSSAGGSVTLAVISDIFEPEDPMIQHATSFIVLSSVGGSIIGPIIGGFIEEHLDWRWCLGIQVLFGVFVQLLHHFFMPETRVTVIMNKVAKEERKSGRNPNLYGPGEIAGKKHINVREYGSIWLRPFRMFLSEPIVLVFSLLSGFSDAIIFMMVQSLNFVYWQYGFKAHEIGLAFIPFGLGYLAAYSAYFFIIKHNVKMRKKKPGCEYAQYESRLVSLLYAAPLLPIGLILFAFTSAYLSRPIHWFPSMIGSFFIGIANFCIYMGTIDYVLRAYGPYAASATGGNGWARDFLAGVLTPYAIPMLSVFVATIILFSIAVILCASVFIVFKYGPWLREHSKFAQTLAHAQADQGALGSPIDPTDDAESHAHNADGELNRMVNFLPSSSLPGSQSNLHLPLPSTTPAGTPRCSVQLSRPPAARMHSYHSHLSRLSAEITPIAEDRPTTSSSRTCTCSTERTLTGTCSRCKTSDGSGTGGDNSTPTSLREIENANADAIVLVMEEDEGEVVIISSNPPRNSGGNGGVDQFNEKKRRGHRCSVM
ncbi:MFS general substrate transporter [Annulohypoxylon maeteangense]|uniref:MFS general substrate transporter n=1 Tax=Annulohypoxylon maeteangense TaxID=1927788 RepID=UPI00200737AF|nr:MFS general substrate transporter [Annulohypoxylon maeteangense]KAI0887871.1 MFS general substrate transporter [Annulohypoxylon maeteangense]